MSPKVLSRKINSIALAALFSIGLSGTMLSAQAAVSSNQIVNAVEQAKILSNGTRVSAAINGSEVYVSTYRNARANDNDCKIEAVLIAKTAMDLAPADISRVTVYFHSAANINKRKLVTVTAGDVKAFGSGQLGKDQLMASLTIKDDEVNDPASRLSAYLQQRESARSRRRIDTNMNGETVEVIADADSDMSERDMRYEALKIAEKALENATGAKKVKISFADPAMKGSFRQIDFDASQLRNLDSSLQSALMPVQIVTVNSKVDVQGLSTADGAEKDLRDKALEKLKNLDSKGVGVGPFLRSFFEVERLVSVGNDEQAHTAVVKLIASLDEQEERAKNAKEIKPTKAPVAATTPEATKKVSKSSTNRFSGASAMPDSEILTDPDRALKRQEEELGDPMTKRIEGVYNHIITVLNSNNRAADAQRFTQKLNEIKSRLH